MSMSKGTKITLGIIGSAILVFAIVFIIWKVTRSKPEEEEDAQSDIGEFTDDVVSGIQGITGTGSTFGGMTFTRNQIKSMQKYMLRYGSNVVSHHINSTGGIDGIIGTGFTKAVETFIAEGKAKNIKDLFEKASGTSKSTSSTGASVGGRGGKSKAPSSR